MTTLKQKLYDELGISLGDRALKKVKDWLQQKQSYSWGNTQYLDKEELLEDL